MSTRTSRQTVRNELTNRLENSHWERGQLVEAVATDRGIPTEDVRDTLDGLERRGEVYVVGTEVRKTP